VGVCWPLWVNVSFIRNDFLLSARKSLGQIWQEGEIMRIKIIKFVVKILGYEWSGDELKLPVWQVKAKKKTK